MLQRYDRCCGPVSASADSPMPCACLSAVPRDAPCADLSPSSMSRPVAASNGALSNQTPCFGASRGTMLSSTGVGTAATEARRACGRFPVGREGKRIGAPCSEYPCRPAGGGCMGVLWGRVGEPVKPDDPFGSVPVRAENDICGGSPPSLMNTVACKCSKSLKCAQNLRCCTHQSSACWNTETAP